MKRETTGRRVATLAHGVLAKWALGILGALVTGAVAWLASSVVDQGQAIARVQEAQEYQAEWRQEVREHFKELGELVRSHHHKADP